MLSIMWWSLEWLISATLFVFVVIPLLAKIGCPGTLIVKENHVRAILRGGKMHRIILSSHMSVILDTQSKVVQYIRDHGGIKARLWNIVPKEGQSPYNLITRMTGVHFYIPIVETLSSKELVYKNSSLQEVRVAAGDVNTTPFPYYWEINGAECGAADGQRIPLKLKLAWTLSISNPYLWMYGVQDVLEQVFTILHAETVRWVANLTLDDLLENKGRGVSDRYQIYLVTGESADGSQAVSVAETLRMKYGVELQLAEIIDLDPDERYRQFIMREWLAKQDAEASDVANRQEVLNRQRIADIKLYEQKQQAEGVRMLGSAEGDAILAKTRALGVGLSDSSDPDRLAAIIATEKLGQGKTFVLGIESITNAIGTILGVGKGGK